jgi:hypothetical protein|tara:strand:- start:8926 stop:9204 length:279 start_codon:yes stop_codon:yes gene_type:complete
MGEIVDLAEYKAKKEAEKEAAEIAQLKSDIQRLMGDLETLKSEAGHPVLGPLFWPDDFKDKFLPEIDMMIGFFDGYSMDSEDFSQDPSDEDT